MDPRVQLLEDLADPLRFAIVERLESEPATATELAREVEASPTQLSNHLRRLRESGLVRGERTGRHVVYALADPGVRELISLLNGMRPRPRPPREPRRMDAVSCYDHLAGVAGVALYDALVSEGALMAREGEGRLELGPAAGDVFGRFGVDPADRPARRLPAFACMDSYLNRPHLGGSLGADLLAALERRAWVRRRGEGRELELSPAGREALAARGVRLPEGA